MPQVLYLHHFVPSTSDYFQVSLLLLKFMTFSIIIFGTHTYIQNYKTHIHFLLCPYVHVLRDDNLRLSNLSKCLFLEKTILLLAACNSSYANRAL